MQADERIRHFSLWLREDGAEEVGEGEFFARRSEKHLLAIF